LEEIIFSINGQTVKGKSGDTIITVAQAHGITIPTLCHDPCLESVGACRVCVVEDEKRGNLVASCVTPIAPGMRIQTDSPKVLDARTVIVKLMLAAHPDSCIVCEKGNRCKLRQIAADLGIGLVDYYPMPCFTGTQEVNSFILRDMSKCILCAKCIRADHELVVEGAIDYMDRGFEARPATLTDGPLEGSECTFCGTCVELCPTGALFERYRPIRGSTSKRVATTCSFCGCGCSLWLEVSNDHIAGVRPGIAGSVNGMTLCAKGHYGYEYIDHPDRLQKPFIKGDEGLLETTWEEALQAAAAGLKNIQEKYGGDRIALLLGPHCTNEEAFLAKRFAEHVVKTDHVLSCASLYTTNLTGAKKDAGGFFTPGCTIEELEKTDALLVIGANPTETAPVVGYAVKRAARAGTSSLIVIDPVEIKLCGHADIWLRPALGTDRALVAGFLNLLFENGQFLQSLSGDDQKHIDAIQNSTPRVTRDAIERTTGVPFERLQQAADLFAAARTRAVVFGNGIMLQPGGGDVIGMLRSVSAVSGASMSLFPLLKQSNTLGMLHLGLMDDDKAVSTIDEIDNGRIKALWIIGDDPAEILPGLQAVENALESLEFLLVSHSFLSKTAARADVVFPAATFAEKNGTVTNMEGRLQPIRRAVSCRGESRPDGTVLCQMAKLLGAPFMFADDRDITRQMLESAAPYAHIDPGDVENGVLCSGPLKGSAADAVFPVIREPVAAMDTGDTAYPYTLMVGSILFQLGSGYLTRHCPRLCTMTGEHCIEIHPIDADRQGIADGDRVTVTSPDGQKELAARLSERIQPGTLFLPLPFLLDTSLLPQPGKVCRVTIERNTP